MGRLVLVDVMVPAMGLVSGGQSGGKLSRFGKHGAFGSGDSAAAGPLKPFPVLAWVRRVWSSVLVLPLEEKYTF